MKKNSKIFGTIVFAVTVCTIVASPFSAQAGPATGTTSTWTNFVQPAGRSAAALNKGRARPNLFSKCPFGYQVIEPEQSIYLSARLTPGSKLVSVHMENENEVYDIFFLLGEYQTSRCAGSSLICIESAVTVTGGYVCRFDSFPDDDVCPDGTVLERITMAAYRCGDRFPYQPGVFDVVSCLPGFHREKADEQNRFTCVMDGTTWEQEMRELAQGKICLDPNAKSIGQYATTDGAIETGCAYLSPN